MDRYLRVRRSSFENREIRPRGATARQTRLYIGRVHDFPPRSGGNLSPQPRYGYCRGTEAFFEDWEAPSHRAAPFPSRSESLTHRKGGGSILLFFNSNVQESPRRAKAGAGHHGPIQNLGPDHHSLIQKRGLN